MYKRTQTVFLVGMPGSGKTTVGKKLAARFNAVHIDLDAEIERKADADIPEIFGTHGESHFRRLEADLLRELDLQNTPIVSTGGGAPCFHQNMDYMLQNGIVVYLEMPVKALHQRLLSKPNNRPMFAGKSKEDQQVLLAHLLKEREGFYTRSNYTISGLSVDINSLVAQLG